MGFTAGSEQLLNARGVNAKLLPKGFFLTYLQHAGEIEAIELQDLWAKLLAGAVETEANQHPAFVHVLKQLSVLDARVLGAVGEGNFRFKRSQKVSVKKEQRETIENTANFIGLSEPPPDAQLVFVAVGHLNELGLISVRFHAKKGTQFDALVGGEVHNEIETLEESGRTALTTFGAAFYAACVSNSIGFKPAKITDGWQLLNEVHELAYDTMSSASSAGKSADDALDQIASQQVYTE